MEIKSSMARSGKILAMDIVNMENFQFPWGKTDYRQQQLGHRWAGGRVGDRQRWSRRSGAKRMS